MKIALVTDSTCDLPSEVIAERQITITPLHVNWGEQSYTDGVEITPEQFYQRLTHDPLLPKTSQPAPGEFADKYRLAREKFNADAVLCITISKRLSGTYSSAEAARGLVDFPVQVVDSLTASVALGLIVLAAADARDQGQSLAELVQVAHQAARRTHLMFTVNTLEFLHRGGRIGGAQRFIGTALNIKPILYVKDGGVEALESVRTRKRALSRLIEIGTQHKNHRPLWLGVTQANAPELGEFLSELRSTINPDKLICALACPTIGVHTGPAAIGLAILPGE